MFWYVCLAAGVAFYFFRRREQVKRIFTIAHYEAVYWILGGAATAENIMYAYKNKLTDLSKRRGDVAIVTGGSRGIGLEVVKKLLECDMHVVIACRRIQAGHNAIDALRRNGTTSGQTDVIQLDTSSMTSVRKFVDEFKTKIGKLHLLINNAGIMFVPHSLTEDGFESHLAVNYMGHALLTHLLLPLLKEAGNKSEFYSRIVHVSSCAHVPGSINFDDINYERKLYIPSEAYAQSKLAQILFSNAVNRILKGENARVTSTALHPGVVDTDLFEGTTLKRFASWVPKLLFRTPEEGCRSVVYAALSQSIEGEGGMYISNCQRSWMSSLARDVAQQEKLMRKTAEMLKLSKFCGSTYNHEGE
ncbi:hypothetical protein RUM43_006470 [Polyplax serrata]|uniref:Uncharacterized protein n=1 Tax=Polyplax serrata TaxID=468196 RepID=A0AAN8NYA1_POLSC